MVLPVDVFAGESGQLGDSQAGIEQCPDNEALLMGLTYHLGRQKSVENLREKRYC